jgi:hypothetical protein
MVKTSQWADLNGDKKVELIVTGEWMPLHVYEVRNGKLTEATAAYGLQHTSGWWNRAIIDDLDGDGDADIIAGNLGENHKFQASHEKPFEVFAKDFDRNGSNDIFLAKHYNDKMVPIRGRECTSQQCPMIAQKFPTFLSFAESDLKGILGDDELKSALHYEARLFSTVVFVNEKGKFVAKRLPMEAQLSTVNGIVVTDLDGDGIKDLLLAGNKFDVEVETTPADASPGLFLKGLGNLQFKSMKPLESGFFVPYNVKDVVAIKGPKGRLVVVSSNNDLLRVFGSTAK